MGLDVGTHKATVNITGDNNATASVDLSFEVSGHKFTNYVSDGNATCTADGTKTAKCDYKDCLEEDTQTETKLGHDYQETVTDPTCTTGGYTTHTCSRCDDSYTDNETAQLGHSFEDWQEITSPSCEGDGQRQRVCTECSFAETENIAPIGHTWEPDYTIDQAATCTADGSKSIHCEKCIVTKDSEVIPKTGHSYTNYVESSDATCTESGTKTAECDNGCGERSVVADSSKPALGHDYSIKGDTTPPTCTEQGFTIYQCSRCTETQKGDLIPISGHTPGDAATCTADQTCTVCGKVLTAKLGHTGGTATCIAQAVCTRCGVSYGDKNSSNHTGGEEVRGKTEATTTSEGYTGDTYCLGCGEKIATGTTIPKKPGGGGGGDYTPPTYISRTLSKDGVTVTGSSIHRYATLTVEKDRLHNSGNCDSCEQIREWQGQSCVISIYDVALSHSFRGTVTITFPVSSEYNGKTLTVAHCLKNKLETYDVTVSNGKVTVTVNSLSPFAILDNSKDEPGKENPDTGVTNPFTDVGETSWFFNDVMFVYERGLMAGTSATTFSPGSNTTRAQLAVIFYRMEGSPKVEGRNGFTDVEYGPGTAWYYDAVTWAKQSGVVSGYGNGTFGPGNPVTREQLAAIFYRYAQYKGYDVTAAGSLDRFIDKEKVSPWAKEALTWAVSSGIVNGTGSSQLSPQGTATRAQIAAMLHRFVDWYEQEERQNVTTSR